MIKVGFDCKSSFKGHFNFQCDFSQNCELHNTQKETWDMNSWIFLYKKTN